jgi:hypothetical protein
VVELIRSLYAQPARNGLMWTGEGSRSDTDRENNEVALNEARDQMNPGSDSPHNANEWSAACLGRRATLFAAGADYWHDFPTKEPGESEQAWRLRYDRWRWKAPIPYMELALPAERTFPASWGRLNDEALSTLDVTPRDLHDMFSDVELGDARLDAEKLVLGIYANRAYLGYYLLDANGDAAHDWELRVIEHGYGKCPIRIMPGAITGRKEDGKYWLGMGFYILDLLESIDKLGSAAHTASKFDALPMMQGTIQRNDEGGRSDPPQFTGDWLWLAAGDSERGLEAEKAGPLWQPSFGDKTLNLLMFTLDRVSRITGASEVLEGALAGADETAWARNAKLETAKSKLQPRTDAKLAADVDAAEMIMRMVEAFDEEVFLFARKNTSLGRISLNPAKMRGYETVPDADYRLQLPINWRADQQLMVQIIQATLDPERPVPISWPTIMEKFGYDQPMLEYERWAEHVLYLRPPVMDFILNRKLQELGVELAQEEGMSMGELMATPDDQLPPGFKEAMMSASSVRNAGNAGPGGMPVNNGAMNGRAQALNAFGRGPGGPQPQDQAMVPA